MPSAKLTPHLVMLTNLKQDGPQPTSEDFEKSWGLHESLRLPTGNAGWEAFEPLLVLDELCIRSHANNYASTVGVPSKRETLHKVAALIEAFPLDFKVAEESISPEGWRTLYYSGTYILGCLAAYNFHADQELRRICELDGFTEGLPAVWIGSNVEPRLVAQQTLEILKGLGSGPAKAAYSILAAVQRVSLSRSEIRRCEWWSASWLQHLSARLNANA